MWMVLILLCSFGTEQGSVQIRSTLLGIFPMGAVSALFAYFTIPFVMEYIGDYEMAVKFYSGYTEAKCSLLLETEDANKVSELADDILASNAHVSEAYDAKSLVAYSEGDIEKFCLYKEKVLELDKYDITQYEDYVLLLYEAAMEAYDIGDEELVDFCFERADSVPQKLLEELKENTSPLAYKIQDQPVFEMFGDN
jgi:hypothetical protein